MINPWDNNASKRHKQILDGHDFSFDNVLLPTFIKLINGVRDIKTHNVLDFGCGSGILTYRLSKLVGRIVGIDSSAKSIDIAKHEYKKAKKLEFHCASIYNLESRDKYHVVISNMTIQTIKNIRQAFRSISKIMNSSGTFIFSVPHPCFWIDYRKKIGLDEYENYRYSKNSAHRITFSISNDRNPLPSYVPLYHRPIEYYSTQLNVTGFIIDRLLEPIPNNIENISTNWEIPHFLFFICSKSKSRGA